MENLRAETREDCTRTVKRLYDAGIAREHRLAAQEGGARPDLPTFPSVRSMLSRARARDIPPTPESVEDVEIEGMWAETWNGENVFAHLDSDWGYAIFCTEENFSTLRRCETVYMDGTFRACPQPYRQVFTILGDVRGFVIPLVNVLMANRTTGSYRQVLARVRRITRQITHHNWRPQVIIADFEMGLWNAVETELPTATLLGCYFHLTQNFWRKIQELGLARPYRMNQRLQDTVRKVMAIGYLPIPLLRNNFRALEQSRRPRRLVNHFPALQDFFNYVGNTYIQPNAAFPPAAWNVPNRNMAQRTNNHAENYHSTKLSATYLSGSSSESSKTSRLKLRTP
ncbi:uncharacterized protein LOC143285168 [Babylonia areolata]|uniref:uncharacterized protein LOC143285168 n=1 Tax=Babylonia areolata TaxID=304850 RepID=UPI003FD487FD